MTSFSNLALGAVFLFADDERTRVFVKIGADRAHCPDECEQVAHRIRIGPDTQVVALRRLGSAPSRRFGRHG